MFFSSHISIFSDILGDLPSKNASFHLLSIDHVFTRFNYAHKSLPFFAV